jgi:hypothetical protein
MKEDKAEEQTRVHMRETRKTLKGTQPFPYYEDGDGFSAGKVPTRNGGAQILMLDKRFAFLPVAFTAS